MTRRAGAPGNAPSLTFALLNGELAHIAEERVARGDACGCRCPGCDEPLVAKKGKARAQHFAHASGAECAGGAQTALHLASIQILLRARSVALPELLMVAEAVDEAGGRHKASAYLPPRRVAFERATSEKRFGQVIPDIAVWVGERRLFIEVAVHHFADEEKKRKLAEAGVTTVEIDASGLIGEWDWKADESARRKRERDERQRLGDRAALKDFQAALALLDELSSPERVAFERARMNAEGPEIGVWRSAERALGLRWDAAPARVNNPQKSFSAGAAARWCLSSIPLRPGFSALRERRDLLSAEELERVPFPGREVGDYLRSLAELGFIKPVAAGRYQILKRSDLPAGW